MLRWGYRHPEGVADGGYGRPVAVYARPVK